MKLDNDWGVGCYMSAYVEEVENEEKIQFVGMSEKKDEQGAESDLRFDNRSEEMVVCWLLRCR